MDLLTLAAHLAPERIPFTLFTAHPDLLPESLAPAAGDPLAFAGLTRALRRFELRRRMLGFDHPDTLNSANILALNLRELGDHEQASKFNEDTLARRRRILGKDHPHTLRSTSDLARDLHALGEHEQARQLEEYVRAHRRG